MIRFFLPPLNLLCVCVCTVCILWKFLFSLAFSCHWILLFSDWCQYCSCESKFSCVFQCTEFTDFLRFIYIIHSVRVSFIHLFAVEGLVCIATRTMDTFILSHFLLIFIFNETISFIHFFFFDFFSVFLFQFLSVFSYFFHFFMFHQIFINFLCFFAFVVILYAFLRFSSIRMHFSSTFQLHFFIFHIFYLFVSPIFFLSLHSELFYIIWLCLDIFFLYFNIFSPYKRYFFFQFNIFPIMSFAQTSIFHIRK